MFQGNAQVFNYSEYPVYEGTDLGVKYSKSASSFKIWAPTAKAATIKIYDVDAEKLIDTIALSKSDKGVWEATVAKDLKNKYYTIQVFVSKNNGLAPSWSDETVDPYAKAVSVNGKKAQIIDLAETNPIGWNKDVLSLLTSKKPVILYELQIRDASFSASSGIKNKGKYLGLTESLTKNTGGLSTGLDHIKNLGVTHVHLMPCFDFRSIDETKLPFANYNWGYDPLNYNVPEGSFSSNPFDGKNRIREFKSMVLAFHKKGIKVVMDVVYNHTGETEKSNFNQLVPGYYYRHNQDGSFSNASACGNETASERPMFRKFMLESLIYWVKEYHINGFRFDLMGIHDIETMNIISEELHKIDPNIVLYGEGWCAGGSPLPDSVRAIKANASKLDRIAVFSDDIRDGLKGSVFNLTQRGFVSGNASMVESVKFGIVGAAFHPQIDLSKVNYSKEFYALSPNQMIAYADCHDNHTLWDKLNLSALDATNEQKVRMQQMALFIVLTSQGVPFLHAGSEFLRTKQGVENSFESADSINAINWNLKTINKETNELVRYLIEIRKSHKSFYMNDAALVATNLIFDNNVEPGVISYEINGLAVNDSWKKIKVILNGTDQIQQIGVAQNGWKVSILNNKVTVKDITVSQIAVNPYSFCLLYEK